MKYKSKKIIKSSIWQLQGEGDIKIILIAINGINEK